jgi:hypothetical protein
VTWAVRASVWAALSAVLLFGGLLALGALVARGLPRGVGLELARAIALQALGPLWAATLATWLAASRVAPALDRSLARLALGVAAIAALWFPPIGGFLFSVWSPRGPGDWVGTCAILVGAVTAALFLPRWLVRGLGPGVFARDAGQGNVAG